MPKLLVGLLVPFGLVVAACGDDDGNVPDLEDPAASEEPDAEEPAAGEAEEAGVDAADVCADATLVASPDVVASVELDEISGIAVSRRHDGVIWAHNDSGGRPEVFAIGEDGADLGRVAVDGAEAVDWEDMTIGRGPEAGVDHLYIADTGDNTDEPLRLDDPVTIYRMPEPTDRPGGGAGGVFDGDGAPAGEADAFAVVYEDGPRDAETLMADPVDGTLILVSKQWDGTAAGIYEVPADVVLAGPVPDGPVQMERVADVPETEGVFVTGGEVSADGSLVALRTYTEVRLFDRAPNDTVAEALARGAACTIGVVEPQGEAVAFAPDGRGLVTISEGGNQPLNWHHWE